MTEGNEVPPPPPPADPGVPTMPAATAPVSYAGPGEIETNKDMRTWGMLAHLSALVQLLGLPSIVGPLVVWLIKKNEMPFVDDQGKEALNFHITVWIAALILTPTICLAGLGIILLIALGIAALILSVIAAMKANEGISYRYPWTLRLIK
ncbi:MAG TPA: DUF4870 domain-containing protein [Tepidisphaeraceae bacterium]|nr:DUF4870 domain-containing protein [Tepidisphaeraceae bacterium]